MAITAGERSPRQRIEVLTLFRAAILTVDDVSRRCKAALALYEAVAVFVFKYCRRRVTIHVTLNRDGCPAFFALL